MMNELNHISPPLISRSTCRPADDINSCRVGIELPTIEVRYEQLTVEADVIAAGRALPTLWNAATNFLQVLPCLAN